MEGIADRGQPFNVTDVVDNRLPMQRFLTAGVDGDTWLVAVERGGRAHYAEAYHFSAHESKPREEWPLSDIPANLADVVRQIQEGR